VAQIVQQQAMFPFLHPSQVTVSGEKAEIDSFGIHEVTVDLLAGPVLYRLESSPLETTGPFPIRIKVTPNIVYPKEEQADTDSTASTATSASA
jgi:hypothetical protein